MSPWRAKEETPVDFTKLLYQIEEESDCEDLKEVFEIQLQQCKFTDDPSARPRCRRRRGMDEARARALAPLTVTVTESNTSPPRLCPADISPDDVAAILPVSAVDDRLTPPGLEPASYATLTPIITVSEKSACHAGGTFPVIQQQQSYAALSLVRYDEPSSPQSAYSRRSVSPNCFDRLSPTLPQASPGLDLNAALLAREEQQQQQQQHTQSDMEEINTKELTQRISRELKRHSIPQAIFAHRVLQRSQGTLSDLLSNPKPWSKLKSGKETFIRMWKWLQEPEFQRMSVLGLPGLPDFSTSRRRPAASRDNSRSSTNSYILSK